MSPAGHFPSSKFVGEPPMILANSIVFAAKRALYAAREEAGDTSWFQLDVPATPEKLQMLCGVTPAQLTL